MNLTGKVNLLSFYFRFLDFKCNVLKRSPTHFLQFTSMDTGADEDIAERENVFA